MKINNSIGPNLTQIDNAKSKGATDSNVVGRGSRESGGVGESAQVHVSERAQMMNRANEIASNGIDSVDEAKVARLQKLIDEGKYNISAEAIADRLVDEHMMLPSE